MVTEPTTGQPIWPNWAHLKLGCCRFQFQLYQVEIGSVLKKDNVPIGLHSSCIGVFIEGATQDLLSLIWVESLSH